MAVDQGNDDLLKLAGGKYTTGDGRIFNWLGLPNGLVITHPVMEPGGRGLAGLLLVRGFRV